MSSIGSTPFSDRQFDEVLALTSAGLDPEGVLAELAARGSFSDDELEKLAGPNLANYGGPPSGSGGGGVSGGGSGGGSKGKGGGKGPVSGGSGDGSWINRLLPAILRGDQSRQQSTSGLPYESPTALSPSILGGPAGGISPAIIIGLLAIAGFGAYLLLRKKPTEEHHGRT